MILHFIIQDVMQMLTFSEYYINYKFINLDCLTKSGLIQTQGLMNPYLYKCIKLWLNDRQCMN